MLDCSFLLRMTSIAAAPSTRPARTLEPHLVHGVVQCCARRHHGSTVFGELRAQRTPVGRRLGAFHCSGRPCF